MTYGYIQFRNYYLGYVYRGKLKIKRGTIRFDYGVPFSFVDFEGDDKKRHTKLSFKEYEPYYGHVWGKDPERIRAVIQQHYEDRIRQLEESPALAYAEMIVQGG